MSNCDIIDQPIKFLGATVLSFNSSLGLGSSESRLQVELIEDCEDNDYFFPKDGQSIGRAVYFTAGEFSFGGVLTNWTANQSGSGRTFTVEVVDPRQLLANTIIVIDTYLGSPARSVNYFNVYNFIEGEVLNGNCSVFGISGSNERGMPYKSIITALENMNPTICSPTGGQFSIDFTSFPQGVPDYYSVPGPSITALQLLEDVCDVLGYEFYVNLVPNSDCLDTSSPTCNIISIGLIDLKTPPSSFKHIIASFDGSATDLSYGQELRNEITKTVLLGEKRHYLSSANNFTNFFGEDLYNDKFVPVAPVSYDECGFWIMKKIESLNTILEKPLPTNGPYAIHEMDIRFAMSSMEMWMVRTFNPEFGTDDAKQTLNYAIQQAFSELKDSIVKTIKDLKDVAVAPDKYLNPIKMNAIANRPDLFHELEIIYNWIKNLGSTYYGKQFISVLNQKICYYQTDNSPTAERFFSDIPTNAGGWAEFGTPVLGLSDPNLGLFREEDNRISTFVLFNTGGDSDDESSNDKEKNEIK